MENCVHKMYKLSRIWDFLFFIFFFEVKTIENFHWYGKMNTNKTHSKTGFQASWAAETREIYIREFRVCVVGIDTLWPSH